MSKYLLVGINSKFSHTNLAIRLLQKYASSDDVKIAEYTINEPKQQVLSGIFEEDADAYFFSCYIWNIEFIKELCSDLKKISKAKIILGGPEVSFNATDVMRDNPWIDACIVGEGEITFSEIIKNNLNFENIKGVVFKNADEIITNPIREQIEDISTIPFPYTREEIKSLDGRLIYYETARGCPFSCSYCMSSTIVGVRYRNLEMVKKELKFFVDNNVKIVKLTDRTFNANPKRVYDIFKYLIDTGGNTTFHFEIAAHILTDEIIELLGTAPKDLFQFEIGVQSTNPDTIRAINRTTDFEKICRAVEKVKALNTIHIHLDLIAGLPFEDFNIFKKSFCDVFKLRPDMLQLGFLKLLHGTKIRAEQIHDYLFSDTPPYEVLENKYISYPEILILKNVEEICDKYYNSGYFKNTIEYIIENSEDAFTVFYDIAQYFKNNGLFNLSHSKDGLFETLAKYLTEQNFDEISLDILKLDYMLSGSNKTPSWSIIQSDESFYKKRFSLIDENPEIFDRFSHIPKKDIIKLVRFEEFAYNLKKSKKEYNIMVFFKDENPKMLN